MSVQHWEAFQRFLRPEAQPGPTSLARTTCAGLLCSRGFCWLLSEVRVGCGAGPADLVLSEAVMQPKAAYWVSGARLPEVGRGEAVPSVLLQGPVFIGAGLRDAPGASGSGGSIPEVRVPSFCRADAFHGPGPSHVGSVGLVIIPLLILRPKVTLAATASLLTNPQKTGDRL